MKFSAWNERVKIIIRELDEYVVPGSEIYIICDIKKTDKVKKLTRKNCEESNQKFIQGDITSGSLLEDIKILDYENTIL